jgi:hypothetical protein
MNNAELIKRKYANIWLGNNDTEVALTNMRNSGASPIECIIALSKFKGMSLFDAKVFVHDSKAWADMKDDFDNLHAKIDAIMKDLDETV